jgi:hypothetical protein
MKFKSLITILFLAASISCLGQSPLAQWVAPITDGLQELNAITTDRQGNIYSTGRFFSTVDFDPSTSISNLTSTGGYDIYIRKLDPSGNLLWVLPVAGGCSGVPTDIETDSQDNVFISGYFSITADFDPGSGTVLKIAGGTYDPFILKLDENGVFQWVNTFECESAEIGLTMGMAIDDSDNIIVTGTYSGQMDITPTSTPTFLNANGFKDVFIAKMDEFGIIQWGKAVGAISSNDFGRSIDVTANGSVVIAGEFTGTMDFDPGSGIDSLTSNGGYDAFILKLDLNGDYLWAKTYGASSPDVSRSITVDENNDAIFTGSYKYTVDFNSGGTPATLTNNDGAMFICKVDVNGDFSWVKSIESPGGTGWVETMVIENDANNNLIITGRFSDSIDFDPGVGTAIQTSFGLADVILFMLDGNGDYQWHISNGDWTGDEGRALTVDLNGNLVVGQSGDGFLDFGNSVTYNTGGKDTQVVKYDINVDGNGIAEENEIVGLSIFPNPANGNFTINLGEMYSNVSISLTDLSGRLLNTTAYEQCEFLNLSYAIPSGVYLVIVESSDKKSVIRLIKE